MKKHFKVLVLLLSFVVALSVGSVKAEPKTVTVKLTIDNNVPIVNGQPNIPMMFAPFINNGRTMVCTNFISETFGTKIDWDAYNRIATFTKNKIVIAIQTDSNIAKVNGKEVPIDSPAIIRHGRTAYPIRFIMEAFGATVSWDPDLHKATIVYEIP
jgi:hypothetical protein